MDKWIEDNLLKVFGIAVITPLIISGGIWLLHPERVWWHNIYYAVITALGVVPGLVLYFFVIPEGGYMLFTKRRHEGRLEEERRRAERAEAEKKLAEKAVADMAEWYEGVKYHLPEDAPPPPELHLNGKE